MLLINTIIHNGLSLTYLKFINTLFKAVYVTGLLPYAALISLLARSLTLPGGFQGIQLFFKPDWEQLKNPMVSIYKLSCPWKGLLAQCKVTLHAKMVMLDLQHYPQKLCLINYKFDINVFVFFKLIIFYWSFSAEAAFLVYKKQWRNSQKINTFQVRKTTVSSTFFTRLRFQGYRNKSGVAIFAWRVTLNYAYSPFNNNYNLLKCPTLSNTILLRWVTWS